MEMEEHTWDACGSYLRGMAVYFLYSPNARKKTLLQLYIPKLGFLNSEKISIKRFYRISFLI